MKYSYSLVVLIAFFSIQTHAVDDGDWWLKREIKLQQNREDYARRVYGRSARSFLETDPVTAKSRTVTKIAIAETVPTASKVGSTMLQRVAFYAKNPGVQMVGVIAAKELIEAIGWVMEDGTYVKKKPNQPDPSTGPYLYKCGTITDYSAISACTASYAAQDNDLKKHVVSNCRNTDFNADGSPYRGTCDVKINWTSGQVTNTSAVYYVSKNPKYDPNAQPSMQTIPLTPELLGAAMMGEGYNDPVKPEHYNPIANTGLMDSSVADSYQHSGNGVGDDLANEMDQKLKNAPPTPNNQPAPYGSPQYANPPSESAPNANDRTWDEDGGNADGKTEPIKDHQGNPTGGQSISIEFPVFCEWAFTMCQWYDDWKKTDDWLREAPDPTNEDDPPDLDDKGIFSRKFDTVFTLPASCPPDIPFELNAYYFQGSYTISLRWLCIIFTALGYPLLFVSHCTGIWILYETVIKKDFKVSN